MNKTTSVLIRQYIRLKHVKHLETDNLTNSTQTSTRIRTHTYKVESRALHSSWNVKCSAVKRFSNREDYIAINDVHINCKLILTTSDVHTYVYVNYIHPYIRAYSTLNVNCKNQAACRKLTDCNQDLKIHGGIHTCLMFCSHLLLQLWPHPPWTEFTCSPAYSYRGSTFKGHDFIMHTHIRMHAEAICTYVDMLDSRNACA